jgi:hypothetical protein
MPRVLRRRRLPSDLAGPFDAFLAAVEPVERAKRSVVAAVPTGRSPGLPLAEALVGFEEGLREARRWMSAWRVGRVVPEWAACAAAVEESLGLAESLRVRAPELGFEPLLAAVGDLMAPLEAFERAAERFRDLRE